MADKKQPKQPEKPQSPRPRKLSRDGSRDHVVKMQRPKPWPDPPKDDSNDK